jgi:predicted TIM-barrel fold metal-dependent hydrolase
MSERVLISADSHVQEPTDLWTSRLPADLRDWAPVYERLSATHMKRWHVNGQPFSLTPEYRRFIDEGIEDIAADDVAGYLADLDRDGVWAATLHPNTGLFIYETPRPELAYACARIYNDHVAEVYQSERLYPNALIPLLDPDRAVEEIEHAAKLGLRGLELPQSAPPGRPYFTDAYEAVWAAAQAHNFPIAMHIATGLGLRESVEEGSSPTTAVSETVSLKGLTPDDPSYASGLIVKRLVEGGESGFGAFGGACRETIPALVGSGVLARYPDLHFIFVETNGRWLAALLDNMDESWHRAPGSTEVQRQFYAPDGSIFLGKLDGELDLQWPYDLLPSEYAKRQMHVTFMDDWVALRNRSITGVESLCWGSDYPHYEGTYPRSREAIAAQIERSGLSDEEADAIFGGTLRHLYGMPLPEHATL